ncbi:MAG: circularly permuted type 2 ATP-grasp protein [Verrucomicrobiota bacterium]
MSLDPNWMTGYTPPSGSFDEYLDGQGEPRPHWQGLSEMMGRLDADTWTRRERQLERLIHDNGITYNLYGDSDAGLRPWSMDMLPMVLGAGDFNAIESALSQRASLLNLILNDVYGRQTLLQSNRMHPFLIYANPAFLRPCHGVLSPRQRHLHLYAADIARAPDGSWWVLSDRVEAASGLGYALENRMLMSRVFPKIIAASQTRSLQPFIHAFTSHIESLAPGGKSNPSVALLTAGPRNETYFEQSFLARNLGYTLAEGDDLTVRDNRLYMKTIGGVQPVDVLLRRIDSSWSDPLELRNESLIGIPGLVNAVRQGNVAVANALGSGFVETTAMLAFLPWFCRNYLGENLEMPSVATWWCGQEEERRYVIEHIDSLAIKPTFWESNIPSYFGPKLSAAQRSELIAAIEARPEYYCGQEIVSHATMPVVKDRQLHPRFYQLRVFLTPTSDGWKMMPGGLMRYASEEHDFVVSMQQGGGTKDTWVLADGQSKPIPRQSMQQVAINPSLRLANDLPSRVADNLFWLGRYVERTESLCRSLRVLCRLLVNEADAEGHHAAIPFLVQILPVGASVEAFTGADQKLDIAKVEAAIHTALYSRDDPESLVSNFAAIERNASKVRERLSADTWKRLATMDDLARSSLEHGRPPIFDEDTLHLLDATLEGLASFIGNLMENTTRSQGWRFMEMGRRIERGLSIGFLLRSAYGDYQANDEMLITQLLEWADSTITYRRRFLNTLTDSLLLEVLCFDSGNPRSLIFQTEQLRQLLAGLPHTQSHRHPIDQTALQLYSQTTLGDPSQLVELQPGAATPPLVPFLNDICEHFITLAQDIGRYYFAHTLPATEQKPQMHLD